MFTEDTVDIGNGRRASFRRDRCYAQVQVAFTAPKGNDPNPGRELTDQFKELGWTWCPSLHSKPWIHQLDRSTPDDPTARGDSRDVLHEQFIIIVQEYRLKRGMTPFLDRSGEETTEPHFHNPEQNGRDGTSATSSTGDPYVDWVDSIVNNNGQPLQVGSAPLYGLNGTSTAFSALDEGIDKALTLMSLVPGVGSGMQFVSGLNQFVETGDPTGLILSAAGFVAMVNPCGLVAKGLSAYVAISSALEFAANPTDPMAGLHILGVIGGVAGMFGACFAAGTPILTPDGAIAVEEVRAGDLVLSRNDADPSGPVEAKVVEELFVTVAPVLELRIEGRTITTTGGHPFFAQDRGWVPASELEPGERVLALSGEWLLVECVDDVGHVTTVYNFLVADYHTYFVGAEEWGWSLWRIIQNVQVRTISKRKVNHLMRLQH